MDGIYAERLKHCDKSTVALLAMCITGFLCMDAYLIICLSIVLVPIIKDKCGKIYSKEND